MVFKITSMGTLTGTPTCTHPGNAVVPCHEHQQLLAIATWHKAAVCAISMKWNIIVPAAPRKM
jgi:hypothetical protein